MLKNLFSNRPFIGALAFFVFCVGGSLLYQWHVDRQDAEYEKETEARVEQWNESEKEQPIAEMVVVEETPQLQPNEPVVADANFHPEPHDAPVDRSMDAIDLSKLSTKEYEQAVIQFYHQAGVDPPPKDFEYLWEAPGLSNAMKAGYLSFTR